MALLKTLDGHSGIVVLVAWSPDGSKIASQSSGGVKIWDVESGKVRRTLEGNFNTITWSPDGTKIASGSVDKTVKIWNVESGEVRRTFEGHSNSIHSVAWSPDGSKIVSGSDDKTVKIWNVESGECLKTLEGHSNSIHSVAWSPDGSKFASQSSDGVKIWDIESGECLKTLEGPIFSVAWSPDGTKIVSGSNNKTFIIWDVKSYKIIKKLRIGAMSVSWSPDSTKIVSGSWDTTIKIWDVESGECLETLEGHSKSIVSVAWSPDGSKIVSGSWDETIKIWNVDELRIERKKISTTLEQNQNELKLLRQKERQKYREWKKSAKVVKSLEEYDNRAREWQKKIKDMTLEQYQSLIRDCYETNMSKCKNDLDSFMFEKWKAKDFKNTIFFRFRMENGKEETWCLVEKLFKADPDIPGDTDALITRDQFVDNMLFANWVETNGTPYNVDDREGKEGRPGSERYIRITTIFGGSNRYIVYDDLLKKILKLKRGDGSLQDTSEIGFELPEGWEFPIAIYLKFEKRVAIGNIRGSFGISETHGNREIDLYRVTKIENFNHYENIDDLDKPGTKKKSGQNDAFYNIKLKF